jgi:hypothetical protein
MRRARLVSLFAVCAVTAFAVPAASPLTPEAHAGYQYFCGNTVSPGLACVPSSSPWHNWDRVRSRYPGHQAHNVIACVLMWNNQEGGRRGGVTHCAYTWSSPTWNPMGWNFGDTWANKYESFNELDSRNCCAHTLQGWTSDNQTDG